ncbi:MAG: ATP-binding protein [Coriobacteriaceae bacterium]|nr:ATP-binding protein [Coriobacteriaceae bacterium]
MARRFFGRQQELAALQSKLNAPGFQMAVVYGRRRVGKTTLINKLIDESTVKIVSFVALERGEKEQLETMGNLVLSSLAPELLGSVKFESFEKLFDFVGRSAEAQRVIFLIDEYPYLAKECKYMNSLLQRFVDHEWADTQLFLILCGSLVSYMRESVLGEGAPLHGRSTLELKLRPMGYLDSAAFVPQYTREEQAIVYGLTGGVPKYLEQFDGERPLDENIATQFFSSAGYFTEEQIQTLVTADRTNPTAFNTIISSIAAGHTKYGEIAGDVGGGDISYYLRSLVSAGVLEKRSAKGRPYYAICDGMVSFWFKHVSRAQSLVNAGRGEQYYERVVKERLHDHMGPVFEQMARQYLFAHMGSDELPFFATEIEEYQTSVRDGEGKVRQVELDLVAKEGGRVVLVGECRFRNQRFDKGDLSRLRDKVDLLPMRAPALAVFSLGGFTPEVVSEDVLAVDIEAMYH